MAPRTIENKPAPPPPCHVLTATASSRKSKGTADWSTKGPAPPSSPARHNAQSCHEVICHLHSSASGSGRQPSPQELRLARRSGVKKPKVILRRFCRSENGWRTIPLLGPATSTYQPPPVNRERAPRASDGDRRLPGAQHGRGMVSGQRPRGQSRLDQLPALPRDAELPAEKGLRRGRPKADNRPRLQCFDLRLKPGAAGHDLAGR